MTSMPYTASYLTASRATDPEAEAEILSHTLLGAGPGHDMP